MRFIQKVKEEIFAAYIWGDKPYNSSQIVRERISDYIYYLSNRGYII